MPSAAPIPHFHGLIAATHTPFHPDGSLNLGAVEKVAAHLIHDRVGIVFIGGTTGEWSSLTVDERRQLAERWIAVARGTPLQVVVHVGANCLSDARALAAQAESLGAAAISALSPSFFKPRSIESLIACCADIAQAAPSTPFYFYDIPPFTGVSLPMTDFLDQAPARIPTLAGLKLSHPDLMLLLHCLQADDGRWDICWGIDEWLLGALATGARGAIGSSYNFAAPVYHKLIAAFESGDLPAARAAQLESTRLISLLAGYGYMGAAKAVMGMLGVDVGPPRLPNTALEPAQADTLRRELEALGFFDGRAA
jgi:N-acetylneuraminate lyase